MIGTFIVVLNMGTMSILIIYLLKDKIKKLMGFEINKTKNKKEDPDQKSEKKPRLDDKENPALNKDSNSSDGIGFAKKNP